MGEGDWEGLEGAWFSSHTARLQYWSGECSAAVASGGNRRQAEVCAWLVAALPLSGNASPATTLSNGAEI